MICLVAGKPLDQLADFLDALGIESGGGFIEDHQFRAAEQSLGDAETLFHAVRVGLDPVRGAREKPDQIEHPVDIVIRIVPPQCRHDFQVTSGRQVHIEVRPFHQSSHAPENFFSVSRQRFSEQFHRPPGWPDE